MEAAGVIVLVGVAVTVLALSALHVLPTGLNPLHDAVSHYGITPYRLYYRVLTLGMAVSGGAAAIGLAHVHAGRAWVIVPLWVFAGARALISWFPMDSPGTPPTRTGFIHFGLAVVTFGTVAVAAYRLSENLRSAYCWPSASRVLEPLGWIVVGALVVMLVSKRLGNLFGLGERVYYLAVLVWLAAVGSQLV